MVEFVIRVGHYSFPSLVVTVKSVPRRKKSRIQARLPVTRRVQRRLGVNRYQQLYTLLSQALSEGTITPGATLPTESELMRHHKISRNTVRRALEKLEREKRIVRRRGSGTFARGNSSAAVTSADVQTILGDLRHVHSASSWRLLYFGYVKTPPYVLREAPTFEPRSLLIQRTRALKGLPFAVITSYVTERVGRRLTRHLIQKRPLILAIEDTGVNLIRADQTSSAISATPAVAEQLKVPMGSPVFYIERVTYDDDASPVEYMEIAFTANLYRQRATLQLDRSGNRLCWMPADLRKPLRLSKPSTSVSLERR
jgi:GntR family transcriptional regulator